MSRWFRHYAGMMRDDKLVRVAIRSKQPIERVLWVWGAILESAAEIDDGGRYDFDAMEAAYFLRTDEADIEAILSGLAAIERICETRVARWNDRQFKSDKSAERVRRHRERAKNSDHQGGNGQVLHDDDVSAGHVTDVTLQQRHRNAPETETDTETDTRSNERVGARPIFVRPDGVDADVWADFLRNRKAKKLQNTGTAYTAFLRDLARMSADTGDPPGEVVRRCAEKGWGAIYDYRDKGTNRNGNHGKAPTGIGRTAAAALAAFPELAEHIRSDTGP